MFLEPLLAGAYPPDILADLGPYGGLPVRDGDLAAISEPIDFLGVNYYHDLALERATGPSETSRIYPGVRHARETAHGSLTDMGWPITPEGLYDLLVDIRARYPGVPPIVITENGAAYDDPQGTDGLIRDQRRIAYLESHIRAVQRAIVEGVPVHGYLVWTLVDNFEWAEGYAKRFGLVHLDRATQRRTPRVSAAWYGDVIRRNGLAAKSP